MRYLTGAVACGLILVAGGARAECGNGTSDADVKACLSQELRDSDQRINAVYKAIMAARDEAGKTTLRDQQRAWLKSRDKACNLDNKESDREKWLQAILTDRSKTVCVVRYTFARVGELNDMLTQAGGTPPGDLPPAPEAPKFADDSGGAAAGFSVVDEGYQLHTNATHQRGKWYYEMRIDNGGIAKLGDVLLTAGFEGTEDQGGGVVQMFNIRHTHTDAPATVIGWAIDLDNGLVNIRYNGTWDVQPGAAGSSEVKLNRAYGGYLEGSSPLTALIKRNLLTINLGEKPFAYAIPDGYKPFSEK
jgi:uncharacterized protein YecT (DUF1311 family)